jgi:hypothetical protein
MVKGCIVILMFKRLIEAFRKEKESVREVKEEVPEKTEEEPEEKQEKNVRPLTPHELETFKKGMGITPHNYWTWASRTNNFKLMTDGEYVWVEGYEEHIGNRLPLTQQRAWSWEFINKRLQDFGGQG